MTKLMSLNLPRTGEQNKKWKPQWGSFKRFWIIRHDAKDGERLNNDDD